MSVGIRVRSYMTKYLESRGLYWDRKNVTNSLILIDGEFKVKNIKSELSLTV